jgi:hypothetical protein
MQARMVEQVLVSGHDGSRARGARERDEVVDTTDSNRPS